MLLEKLVLTTNRAFKLAKIAHTARKSNKGNERDRELARTALVQLLADARGVPMKFGQLFIGQSEASEFSLLANGIPPRPLDTLVPGLERALGAAASDVFSQIDESQAAASLGQVHHATLLNGDKVAVKLQYPDIRDAVQAEMRLANLLPGIGPAKHWGFDLRAYKSTLKANMDRELDYLNEADRQIQFSQKNVVPGLIIPKVYRSLCRKTVLVQSWETGQPITDAKSWSRVDREVIGRILIQTLLNSLFIGGEVHGDPHVGNVCVRKTGSRPEVVLLDYGCTIPINLNARLALLKLIIGCRNGDQTDPLRCLVSMGFDAPKLASIANTIPALCRILFEPFLSDEPFSTKYWGIGDRVHKLLGDLRWWFRSAGPASLLLLMRAFQGLVSQLEALRTPQPWWHILHSTVGPSMIDRAKAFEPPSVSLDGARQADSFQCLSRYLKIDVRRNGVQSVNVTLPASQLPSIRDHVPENVLSLLGAHQIDLDQIVETTCLNGLVPGEVFSLDSEGQSYRVWLE